MDIKDILKSWLSLPDEDKFLPENFDPREFVTGQALRAMKEMVKSREEKSYIYMVTFTIDPKRYPTVTKELEFQIEGYIKEQASRTALGLKSFMYSKELHKNGRPYWHVLINSSKSLKKSLFTYYQKKFGNIDFSKTKGKTDQEIKNYISKDVLPTELI